jgi:hypothetical protein
VGLGVVTYYVYKYITQTGTQTNVIGETISTGESTGNTDFSNSNNVVSQSSSTTSTISVSQPSGNTASVSYTSNPTNSAGYSTYGGGYQPIQSISGVSSSGVNYSTAQASAPSNTVIGYTSLPTSPNTATTPVYSSGSSFQGAGEYVASNGAEEYISSQSQYNQQQQLGYL